MLEFIFKRSKFPITANPPSQKDLIIDDMFADQEFYNCEFCNCIQLGTLIDPNILYKNPHNDTYLTPTWKKHHHDFAEFVLKNTKNDIVEIGGNGIIHEILKDKKMDLQYSILDICEPTLKKNNINYLFGNCEDYKFQKNETVVMSHVFEHLFNPRKFIENMYKCKVDIICISIPNMLYLINSNHYLVLHNEHTYYIDKNLIVWLFSQYNYELEDYEEYINHSLFFKFNRKKQYNIINLIKDTSLTNKILKSINPFFNIKIKESSFICPAGLYGQLLMYYYKDVKILGFLDNDKTKQNCRVYGSPYYVYSFDKILEYKNSTIYLLAGLYNNEIKKQINSYNINCEIIEINV
jgi:hypothetical protein